MVYRKRVSRRTTYRPYVRKSSWRAPVRRKVRRGVQNKLSTAQKSAVAKYRAGKSAEGTQLMTQMVKAVNALLASQLKQK